MKGENQICPCGSQQAYETCCGKYHTGKTQAETAEALMRSRYSAFAKHQIAYLKDTTWPSRRLHFDEASYLDRAQNSLWLGLAILETEGGNETDKTGTVTFAAKSIVNGNVNEQVEKSLFKKKSGQWFYVRPMD